MSEHKTFFGKLLHGEFESAFGDLKRWLKDIWENANHDVIDLAITLTDLTKTVLNNKAVDQFITFTKSTVDNDMAQFLRSNVVTISADLLLIKGVEESTNEEELQKVAQQIVNSFGGLSDEQKEVFYTSLAAKLYIVYQKVKAGEKVTFGEAAALVEGAFKSSK